MPIRNSDQLKRELMKILGDAMMEVTIDAENIVKDHIQTDVYDEYDPENYIRTGQFKESIDSKIDQVGTHVRSEIFHNMNRMRSIAPYEGNNFIGQHYSTFQYSVKDYRIYLPYTINHGIDGKRVFGDGVYSRPRPYFTNAQSEIEIKFKDNLKRSLVRKGLKIVGD
jgi:hypothetical protein